MKIVVEFDNLSEAENIASELKKSLVLSEKTSKNNIVKAEKNMKDRKNIINHEKEVMKDNIFIDEEFAAIDSLYKYMPPTDTFFIYRF